jgi:ATP-dependent protease ClpP protease subunit
MEKEIKSLKENVSGKKDEINKLKNLSSQNSAGRNLSSIREIDEHMVSTSCPQSLQLKLENANKKIEEL